MNVSSIYPVIGTDKVAESREFYLNHFGYSLTFDADWYVSLIREGDGNQLALVDYNHPTMPEGFRKPAQGIILNFETDDVDEVYQRIVDAGLPIHRTLRDEDFGQRHFITSDPNGVLIDVIKLIPPTGEYAAQFTDLAENVLTQSD